MRRGAIYVGHGEITALSAICNTCSALHLMCHLEVKVPYYFLHCL